MIRLLSQVEIENRLGTGSVPLAAPVLDTAIMAAHLRVEAELGTYFSQQSNDEIFLLELSKIRVAPDHMFRLRLKNGFVRASPAITLTCGESVAEVQASDAETVEGFVVDAPRGIVYVPDDYEDSYVRVRYDSGFVLDEDTKLIDPTPPEALREALLACVPVMLDLSAQADSTRAAGAEAYKALKDHMGVVLSPIARQMGFLLKPIW